jgi:pyridoxamine 5'-phosphate oxidase family protein
VRVLFYLGEIAIAIAVVVAIVAAVMALSRGRGQGTLPAGGRTALPAGGRWQAHHYAEAGDTVVTVARLTRTGEVVEEHVVARIADQDDDWSRKFLAAKQEAEERAFHLNADG